MLHCLHQLFAAQQVVSGKIFYQRNERREFFSLLHDRLRLFDHNLTLTRTYFFKDYVEPGLETLKLPFTLKICQSALTWLEYDV